MGTSVPDEPRRLLPACHRRPALLDPPGGGSAPV